jgi:hypothetical protein
MRAEAPHIRLLVEPVQNSSRPDEPFRRMRVERPGRYFRPLSQTIFCEGFCILLARKLLRAAAVPFPRIASDRLVSHEPCLVVRHSCYFRVSLTRSANRCCHQMLLGEYGLTSAPAQHSCGRAAVPRRGVLHTRKSGSSRGAMQTEPRSHNTRPSDACPCSTVRFVFIFDIVRMLRVACAS